MIKNKLAVYIWLLLAIILWFGFATWKFGIAFYIGLRGKILDVNWWAENTLSFVIFTVLVSWIMAITQKNIQQQEKEKYKGWILEQKGLEQGIPPQEIYWMDMQRNNSEFERWKFIKSAVSSICWIKTTSQEEACNRWLKIDEQAQKYIVDYSKMGMQDVSSWNVHPLPEGWKMVEVEEKPKMRLVRKEA